MRLAPALVLTVAAGGLLSVQGRINGDLSTHLAPHGAPVAAATVSFAVGMFALAGIVGLSGAGRPTLARIRVSRPPWWYAVGGVGGAVLVSVSAASVPAVGVALTSVFVVTGQAGGSLVVDEVGLSPGGRRPLTGYRLVGALLAVGALAVGALGRAESAIRPLLLLGTVLAGVLVAGQQAVNGRLQGATGSAAVTALVSFAVGTACLLAFLGVQDLSGRLPSLHAGGAWWLYVGGLGGATYIALSATCVQVLGVLRLSLASVAGQLAGGVLLDLAAPSRGAHVTVATYLAVLLTFVALLVAGVHRPSPLRREGH